MQFFILLIGVLIFAVYQFQPAPVSFNSTVSSRLAASAYRGQALQIQQSFDSINLIKEQTALQFTAARRQHNEPQAQALKADLNTLNVKAENKRGEYGSLATQAGISNSNDTNYIFLSFVKTYLPSGLRGLLIAVIFLASWGSIAAALNALAASTVVDFHQRFVKSHDAVDDYRISRWYTFAWGVFCILVAQFATQLGNSLIEAVNVLGSLFYGVILGIFLLAFYVKRVKGNAAFAAALLVEIFVVLLFFKNRIPALSFLPEISFLWLNAIGALAVVLVGLVLQQILPHSRAAV